MKILITDANILIDLIKTEVEEPFFKLENEIYTTLAVIFECNDEQQEILKKYIKINKLTVYRFNAEDDEKIDALIKEHRGLSPADCSVFYLTSKLKATLLTGDGALRKKINGLNLEVCGIFWVFDEMLRQQVIDKTNYKSKLARLKEINRWLPDDEFGKRLKDIIN